MLSKLIMIQGDTMLRCACSLLSPSSPPLYTLNSHTHPGKASEMIVPYTVNTSRTKLYLSIWTKGNVQFSSAVTCFI